MNKFAFLLFFITFAALAETQTDIEYARIAEMALKLDLHLPNAANLPLIVYVHGGAWQAGSKSDVPIAKLLGHEFAKAYEEKGLPVKFITLSGSKHGGDEFYDDERTEIVARFLQSQLKAISRLRTTRSIEVPCK